MKSIILPPRQWVLRQSGINMVDLMMWLVIAALLLATAIQSIGYYQKASQMHILQSDLTGVGSSILATAAQRDGVISKQVAEAGALDSKWSAGVSYVVEGEANKPYIRAYHPTVTGSDVIYLFEACGDFNVGVNVVPKESSPALTECGISPTPGYGSNNPLSWSEITSPGIKKWTSFVSSSDGKKLFAGNTDGSLFTSTDSGLTWTQNTTSGSAIWNKLSASADGTKIFAVRNGYMHRSFDSGATWINEGVWGWYKIESSADGNTLVGIKQNGYVFLSRNSGDTWEQIDSLGNKNWRAASISPDGKNIIVGQYIGASKNQGALYSSTDSGQTWKELAGPSGGLGVASWYATEVFDNPNQMIVGQYEGYLYTTSDGGTTWKEHTELGVGKWEAVAGVADGTRLIATQHTGFLYTSTDAGVTWTKDTDNGLGIWYDVAVSAGGNITIGKFDGSLYMGRLQ